MNAKDWIGQADRDVDSVNHILEDNSQKITIIRTQNEAESTRAGFSEELTDHTIEVVIDGRIDRKDERYIGLTNYSDCQKGDVWRVMNQRDDQLHYIVKEVLPRSGGCQVELEMYAKWEA